jgi:hypothetical protein
LIAPIVCSRSDQVKPLEAILARTFFPDSEEPEVNNDRDGDRNFGAAFLAWAAIFALIIVAAIFIGISVAYRQILAGLTWLQTGGNTSTGTTSPEVSPYATDPSSLAATLTTGIFIYLLWRRLHQALQYGRVTGNKSAKRIRMQPLDANQGTPSLLRAARLLNRPQIKRTNELDIPATVQSTAAAGGRFSPTSLERRIPASWMLLVERAGHQDPTAEFGEHLSVVLTRSGVRHNLYEFRHSPQWVRRKGVRDEPVGTAMLLERALATDRPTRILMLAEAATVVDERTGGPADWLHEHDMPLPILLTPNAERNWSVNEAAASQAGIPVFHADATGIGRLARQIQLDQLVPAQMAPSAPDYFDQWQAQHFTLLSQVPQSDDTRDELVETMRALLDPSEFRLLVGVAAFPEVRLDLMATLDKKLHPDDSLGEQRSRFLTLGRLVWIREGFIPTWLRQDLLGSLGAPQIRKIREAWVALLADESTDKTASAELQVYPAGEPSASSMRGDGLFLSLLHGEYDLATPLSWAGAPALLRLPDRTELRIAAVGVAIAIATLASAIDTNALLDHVLQAWYLWLGSLQSAIELPWPRQFTQGFAAVSASGATIWFLGVLLNRIQPRRSPTQLVIATAAAIATLSASWIGTTLSGRYDAPVVALDLFGPIVLACAVGLLLFWPSRPASDTTIHIMEAIQRARGTGVSDQATMLALLWLFSAGLLLKFAVPAYTGWAPVAAAWLVAVATLGVLRAVGISCFRAQLQDPQTMPAYVFRDVAIGITLGQAAGAQLAWTILRDTIASTAGQQATHFGAWHLTVGLMSFGSAIGAAAALFRYGNRNLTPLLIGALYTLGCLGPAIALATLGANQYAPFSLLLGLWPLPLVPVLGWAAVRSRIAFESGVPTAFSLLFLPATIIALLALVGHYSASMFSWMFPLALVATTAATWPLLQRLITEDPSTADEASGWRPRLVSTVLWAFAPLVLLTSVEFGIGTSSLIFDFDALMMPLAIVLAWLFGLRGFRAILLMILPAFWPYVPVLLSAIKFAPLQVLLPTREQFAAPDWFSPPNLDVALTTLLLAALFARATLFSTIRATTSLSWPTLVAFSLLMCVQVTETSTVGFDLSTSTATTPPICDSTTQNCRNGLSGTGAQGLIQTEPLALQDRRTGGKPSQKGDVGNSEARHTLSPLQSTSNYPWGELGWSPRAMIVVGMFLFALTSIPRTYLFPLFMILASLGSVALGIDEQSVIRPIPLVGAVFVAFAFFIGRYFAIISELLPHRPRVTEWLMAPFLISATVIIHYSDAFPELRAYPPPTWLGDGLGWLHDLMWLLAWVAGVRLAASRARYAYGALLYTAGLPMIAIFALQGTPGFVLDTFIPGLLFSIGTRCGAAAYSPVRGAASLNDISAPSALQYSLRWVEIELIPKLRSALKLSTGNKISETVEVTQSGQPVPMQVSSPTLEQGTGRVNTSDPSEQKRVSPNNPCPFLRALVADGYLPDENVSLGELSKIVRQSAGRSGIDPSTFLVGLIANGVSPRQVLRNAWSGADLSALRGGPLDKLGMGSRILDADARVDETELARLASFGRYFTSPDGQTELGLAADDIKTFMWDNIKRAGNKSRWFDQLLMQGEWPVLLRIMGKGTGDERYLSMAEIRTLFYVRRLPDRIVARLTHSNAASGSASELKPRA